MELNADIVYEPEEDVFWGELAPTEHVLHLYKEDDAFFTILERYVISGLAAGEAVVVIPTAEHQTILSRRLERKGFNLAAARRRGQYIDIPSETCLETFMTDGRPDPVRFHRLLDGVLDQARMPGRKVRGFGEMVAVLWSSGHCGATIQLEHMWNSYRSSQAFPLFCSYPWAGFTSGMEDSLREICNMHTKVVTETASDRRGLASLAPWPSETVA
jgi:hypothetical protein